MVNTCYKDVFLYDKYDDLWAVVDHNQCCDLAELAVDEVWSFGNSDDLSILKNYLKYTFYRLSCEGNKVLIDNKSGIAVFNTGLLHKSDDNLPIYAVFERLDNSRVQWNFKSYITANSASYARIAACFPRNFGPGKADYNQEIQEFFSPANNSAFVPNVKHIHIDRLPRFPVSVLKGIDCWLHGGMPKYEWILHGDDLEIVNERLSKQLSYELNRMPEKLLDVEKYFKYAVQQSIDIFNKKLCTLVPSYYPTENTISMLLPIWLQDTKGVPDLALVLNRSSEGSYCKTVLTMQMAYKDARVVGPVDSYYWLKDFIVSDSKNG